MDYHVERVCLVDDTWRWIFLLWINGTEIRAIPNTTLIHFSISRIISGTPLLDCIKYSGFYADIPSSFPSLAANSSETLPTSASKVS